MSGTNDKRLFFDRLLHLAQQICEVTTWKPYSPNSIFWKHSVSSIWLFNSLEDIIYLNKKYELLLTKRGMWFATLHIFQSSTTMVYQQFFISAVPRMHCSLLSGITQSVCERGEPKMCYYFHWFPFSDKLNIYNTIYFLTRYIFQPKYDRINLLLKVCKNEYNHLRLIESSKYFKLKTFDFHVFSLQNC